MTTTAPKHAVSLTIETPKGAQTILPQAGAKARLTTILRHDGLPLNTRCGERGLCDGCMIELVRGKLIHHASGQTVEAGDQPLLLRGCEHHVAPGQDQVCLRLPARSLLAHEPKVVSEFKLNVPWANNPLFPTPVLTDPQTMTLGVAVDVGTTTVAVLLVDLASGKIVGQAAGFNRQMHLGDDVVTRINLCSSDPAMLTQLQHAVVQHTIAPLVAEALKANGLDAEKSGPGRRYCIAGFSLAGNTTMLHLLAGVDPTPMGVAPFTPVFVEHRVLHCLDIGLHLGHHSAPVDAAAASALAPQDAPPATTCADPVVHLLPSAAAYIGADLVAGILACGLAYADGPALLVDVGTNGEIILKHKDTLRGCATAAGPAFEGAKLASGIRAGKGAISDIHLYPQPFTVTTKVIGGGQPIGLCGSAYIDFLAEARRVGLINAAGRFDPAALPPGTEEYLVHADGHTSAFRVAQTRGGQDIVVTETDIAALLQAKAAIAAGILTLLEQAGLQPADIKRLYLAGGFGTHMNRLNAIGCGLLPGFQSEQVQVVGNSALAGAYLAMIDQSALEEMNRIAQRLRIVELNLVPSFEDRYIDQLLLP